MCWQLSRRCPVVLGTISKILRESHSDYVLNRIFQQITHFLDIFQPICLIFNIFRGESLSWSWSVGHSVGRSHFSRFLFYIAPRVPYGPVCSPMGPYGSLWSPMVLYGPFGPLLSPLVPYGTLWLPMVLYGPLWSSMDPLK